MLFAFFIVKNPFFVYANDVGIDEIPTKKFVHFYVRQRRNVLHQRVVHDRKPYDPFLLLTGSGPATATYRYYISFIGQMQYFSSAKRARPFRDCSGRVFCFLFLLFFIRRNGSTAYNSFFLQKIR